MVYLYMIGLGLSDETDVTVKGLEVIKKSKKVFLESYTSLLNVDVEKLEAYYGKKITVAYRETCEIEIDEILDQISEDKEEEAFYSILVVGDPFCATTHSDMFLRGIQRGIKVKAIHNASIMNAIGICGLQVYMYGQSVSVPFYTENWKPYSFIKKIALNYQNNQHTLVLLDIRVREISEENLIKGKQIYEPPHFMSVNVCVEQIFEAEENEKTGVFGDIKKIRGIGVSRIGAEDQQIVSGTLEELLSVDFGKPLHSLIIPSLELHHTEKEMFDFYRRKQLII